MSCCARAAKTYVSTSHNSDRLWYSFMEILLFSIFMSSFYRLSFILGVWLGKACRWSVVAYVGRVAWGELVIWGDLDLGRIWFGASWYRWDEFALGRVDSKPCAFVTYSLLTTAILELVLQSQGLLQIWKLSLVINHGLLCRWSLSQLRKDNSREVSQRKWSFSTKWRTKSCRESCHVPAVFSNSGTTRNRKDSNSSSSGSSVCASEWKTRRVLQGQH